MIRIPYPKFENKWIRNQVENHLIFQIFCKYIQLGWFLLALLGLKFLYEVITKDISSILSYIIYIFVVYTVTKESKYVQAAIGWLLSKFTLFIVTLLGISYGIVNRLAYENSNALYIFILGIIWLPNIEFVPRISNYQKIITLFRIIFSLPVIYIEIKSGH